MAGVTRVVAQWRGAWAKDAVVRARVVALRAAALAVVAAAKELCPVDTGRLKGSLKHEIRFPRAIIGTGVEYAPYVEYGTRRAAAQPYLRPAVERNVVEINRVFLETYRAALSK